MSHYELSLHPGTANWIPWLDLSRIARSSGYAAFVVSRDAEPTNTPPALPASSMLLTAEVRRDQATFEQTFPRLRPLSEFAAKLGAKSASCAIPSSAPIPKDQYADLLRARLKPCCDVLAEFGMRLAVECLTPLHIRRAHPYEFIWHNAEMLDFARSIAPNTGLIVDAWHWHHGGSHPSEILDLPADAIADVHITDSPDLPPEQIHDYKRALPGTGVVDFPTFFDLLRQTDYARPITVEGFIPDLERLSPEDAAALAFQHSRAVVP